MFNYTNTIRPIFVCSVAMLAGLDVCVVVDDASVSLCYCCSSSIDGGVGNVVCVLWLHVHVRVEMLGNAGQMRQMRFVPEKNALQSAGFILCIISPMCEQLLFAARVAGWEHVTVPICRLHLRPMDTNCGIYV